jgi:hypothetical protein
VSHMHSILLIHLRTRTRSATRTHTLAHGVTHKHTPTPTVSQAHAHARTSAAERMPVHTHARTSKCTNIPERKNARRVTRKECKAAAILGTAMTTRKSTQQVYRYKDFRTPRAHKFTWHCHRVARACVWDAQETVVNGNTPQNLMIDRRSR